MSSEGDRIVVVLPAWKGTSGSEEGSSGEGTLGSAVGARAGKKAPAGTGLDAKGLALAQAASMKAAAANGTPFCEECAQVKADLEKKAEDAAW